MKPYKEVWDLQEKLFAEVIRQKLDNRELPPEERAPTTNYLILCQHPHVYTLGKSGNMDNLLLDENDLKTKEAEFFHINRGGDITYHGPGQIVGYPIIDLDNFTSDIHVYLRRLEESIIMTLTDYGLDGGRIDGLTGVWLDHVKQIFPRKICAIGVRTSRWVTMHGFALNVNTDLSYFQNIVPCGIDDKAVTSLSLELNREIDMEEVESNILKNLESTFGFFIKESSIDP